MIFEKFIGYFGIKDNIAWGIAVVCINCGLSAFLLVRLFKIQFNWKLIFVFSINGYMLFSEPFFYIFMHRISALNWPIFFNKRCLFALCSF